MEGKELIFVYNLDSGLLTELMDYARKLVAPETYKCNLCKVTFNITNMKSEWEEYINSLPTEINFFHRDKFKEKYPDFADASFPAVFIKDQSGMRMFITSEELNKPQSVAQMIVLLKEKLNLM